MVNLKFGVPCSRLKEYTKDVDVNCTDEGEAMAIASGCILCGRIPEVYMQNSGLGNIVDIVTSLYKPYKIPLPQLVLSIRSKPSHHEFMYKITKSLLNLIGYYDWVEYNDEEN